LLDRTRKTSAFTPSRAIIKHLIRVIIQRKVLAAILFLRSLLTDYKGEPKHSSTFSTLIFIPGVINGTTLGYAEIVFIKNLIV